MTTKSDSIESQWHVHAHPTSIKAYINPSFNGDPKYSNSDEKAALNISMWSLDDVMDTRNDSDPKGNTGRHSTKPSGIWKGSQCILLIMQK